MKKMSINKNLNQKMKVYEELLVKSNGVHPDLIVANRRLLARDEWKLKYEKQLKENKEQQMILKRKSEEIDNLEIDLKQKIDDLEKERDLYKSKLQQTRMKLNSANCKLNEFNTNIKNLKWLNKQMGKLL